MYYDITVIENPAYKGVMRLPLNIFCSVILAGDTLFVIMMRYKWKLCSQKDLVKADTVSGTACNITVLLI